MAFRPPSAPAAPGKGKKTVSPPSKVQPPLVLADDTEPQLPKLPYAALVRGYGRYNLSIVEARQAQLLTPFSALELGKSLPRSEDNLTPEKKLWGDQQSLSKIPFKVMKGHRHIVSSCNFCVDDTKLLSGSYDYTVKLWDAVDGSVVRDFEPRPSAPVSECSVTADSKRIVAASYDKTVRAWDLETGKLLWKIHHETFIASCKLSPDGKYVVSALDVERGLCITDAENATTVSHIKNHHSQSLMACCFDPDSQRVASVSVDKSVKIWDMTSQATLLTIAKAHSGAISNCCFTFSGHFLCTSSWDKTLKIWNVHTGEFRNCGACVTLMQGHEGSVSSCHFARDTSVLVSGGFDRTVALWDVGEGYRKLSLKGHNDWVTDVAISNDKKWVLSASKCGVLMNKATINRCAGFCVDMNSQDIRVNTKECDCRITWYMFSLDRTLRLWNIEQIDQIPLVIKYKKTLGSNVKQCEVCDRSFSIYESDIFSETVTKCVLCRMNAEDLSAKASSSSEGEDSLPKECRRP